MSKVKILKQVKKEQCNSSSEIAGATSLDKVRMVECRPGRPAQQNVTTQVVSCDNYRENSKSKNLVSTMIIPLRSLR